MRADEVLSNQTVREIMTDCYTDREDAIIFVVEPSITPDSMMFMPFINVEFSKDSKLGMVYGTGRGCAFIRKSALEDLQALVIESNKPIRTCKELIVALERKGYRVKQNPLLNLGIHPTLQPTKSTVSQSSSNLWLTPTKYLILMVSMAFIGAFLGVLIGRFVFGDWKLGGLGGLYGVSGGLFVSWLIQRSFRRKNIK